MASLSNKQLFIIGAGNMGGAVLRGILKHGVWPAGNISCVRSKASRDGLPDGIEVLGGVQSLPASISGAVILLGVKPQVFQSIGEELSGKLGGENLIISVMAGTSVRSISSMLNAEPDSVVRTMPNLPASIGEGMTALYFPANLGESQRNICRTLLGSCGQTFDVSSEDFIDKATAVAGSGSGYCFYFAEAMMEQAVKFGFSEDEAKQIVSVTLKGAAALLDKNSGDATSLRHKVTSKNGTTEAAIKTFDNGSLKQLIGKGMEAAYRRAVEISQEAAR